jgi:hypothetical protein
MRPDDEIAAKPPADFERVADPAPHFIPAAPDTGTARPAPTPALVPDPAPEAELTPVDEGGN